MPRRSRKVSKKYRYSKSKRGGYCVCDKDSRTNTMDVNKETSSSSSSSSSSPLIDDTKSSSSSSSSPLIDDKKSSSSLMDIFTKKEDTVVSKESLSGNENALPGRTWMNWGMGFFSKQVGKGMVMKKRSRRRKSV